MKKLLPILVAILLIGVGVAALATFGIINIPGISPVKSAKKVAAVAKKDAKSSTADAPPVKPAAPAPVKTALALAKPQKAPTKPAPNSKIDQEAGAESLAALWNEMDSAKLKDVVGDWKDAEVARVFLKMDPDKVAEVLALLEPKRASKISAMVEKQASVVKLES